MNLEKSSCRSVRGGVASREDGRSESVLLSGGSAILMKWPALRTSIAVVAAACALVIPSAVIAQVSSFQSKVDWEASVTGKPTQLATFSGISGQLGTQIG